MRRALSRRTGILDLRNVQYRQRSRSARSRINSRSCPFRVTTWKRIIREVQSLELPKINTITSKREIQLETHRRRNLSITDRWHRDELCRNSPIAIGWTEEHCQYLIRLCQLISHTQLQEKSVEDVRTNSGRQWSMTEAGTNDDQGRFPTSSSPPQRFETASGRAESVHSENICDYDNVQLKKKRSWNVNGKVVWSWFYLLLNMMDATRMARNKDKDPRCSNGGPLQNERTICDLSRSFVAGKSDSLVGDGV